MNKQRLRQKLLEGMDYCSQLQLKEADFGDRIIGFKAGISDRLIFRRIIEKYFAIIIKEHKEDRNQKRSINAKGIALNLMTKFYWRDYAGFDDNEIKEYKESHE